MPLDMGEILKAMADQGWAATTGTPREVRLAGYTRTTEGRGRTSTVLHAYTEQEAPPRSLSAVYGLREQPLHSDGAHLPTPPDVIVLYAKVPTPTPTVVWKFNQLMPIAEAALQGVFTVRGNGGSFLASAFEDGRVRFDPVCMSPGDLFAAKVVEEFKAARAGAHVHEWTEPDSLLFIDNRRALHARNAVAEDDLDRKVERLALRREAL